MCFVSVKKLLTFKVISVVCGINNYKTTIAVKNVQQR